MKKYLSKVKLVANFPLIQRARAVLNLNPAQDLKPLSKSHIVSDLFVFRCSDDWSTELSLFNFPSYMYPDAMCQESCLLVFYDASGFEVGRKSYELASLEMKRISISDCIPKSIMLGSFSVFHHSTLIERVKKQGSYITERGYVGYKNNSSDLYSYCHGNMKALSKSVHQNRVRSVVGRSKVKLRYRPQLLISDSDSLELIYVNPSPSQESLLLKFFDKQHQIVEEHFVEIPKFGTYLHKIDNSERLIHTFENWGRIVLWRPVIFKYYKTHFDVLHG